MKIHLPFSLQSMTFSSKSLGASSYDGMERDLTREAMTKCLASYKGITAHVQLINTKQCLLSNSDYLELNMVIMFLKYENNIAPQVSFNLADVT